MGLTEAGAMALSAAGSLASNTAGGLFNINQAAKNRSFQERMFYKQIEENRKNWEIENEYNLPSAVRQRLEDANLNSYLMYGEGASGMTSQGQIGNPSLPGGSAAHAQFENSGLAALQGQLIHAQIANIDANTQKTESETDWQEIENRFNRDSYDIRLAIQHGDLDLLNVKMEEMRNNIVNSSMITSQQLQTMIQGRLYEVKRFNLDFDTQGAYISQGWKHLSQEDTRINQRWRELAIMWRDIQSQIGLRNAQIGQISNSILWENRMNPLKLRGLRLDVLLKKWDTHLKKADLNDRQVTIVRKNLENWYYGRYGTTTPFEGGQFTKDITAVGRMMDASFVVPWIQP